MLLVHCCLLGSQKELTLRAKAAQKPLFPCCPHCLEAAGRAGVLSAAPRLQGGAGPSTAARLSAGRCPLAERNAPDGPGSVRQNLWQHRRAWKIGGVRAMLSMVFLHCLPPQRTCPTEVMGTQERCLLTLF